jgi:hypothetical protein
MQLGDEIFIFGAVFYPQSTEMNVVGKGSEERKNIDDLKGVRGQFGLADRRRKLWRRVQV